MSSPASITNPETVPAPAPKARRMPRARVVLAFMAGLVLVCVFTPAAYRSIIHTGLLVVAHEEGLDLHIAKMKGSVFEPVSFYGARLSGFSQARTMTDVYITRADVEVSLYNLIFKGGMGCLRAVTIDGLNARVKLQEGTTAPEETPHAAEEAGTPWLQKLIPAKLDAIHVNLTFQEGDEFVRLQNLRCSASDVEPGVVSADRVVIQQPWLNRTFIAVKGTTAVQNEKFSIANLSLENGMSVLSASSDLKEIANGRLKVEFEMAAFNGSIRGEIKSAQADLHSLLEANGSFAQISVAPLAAFFGFSGKAGGVIHEGKFTFSGSLRNLEKATLSVDLEATDFQLGNRQWNSLVGRATMVEHHVQIPELHLKQAHNELTLKGDMMLPPGPGVEWWQSEFAFDITAKIDNLTELSELFGPDFADMAGKMNIDGSIKGSNQAFSGDLAVSGSDLSYRTAPLDTLHATIHLKGNELQVDQLELASKNDFIRGKGVVNILGQEKRYWGELKASVADLSRYSAIMQKPFVPQPLAGGLTVDWSGDGVAKAHSGAFHAQLKKFRQVSVTEPKAHPLNADLEATYSPGNIFFSKFVLWDTDTNFSAKVTAAPKTLNLQALHLQQNNTIWLEGDALLPFNVWSAWENASWATLLEFDSPCKVNVTAKNLDLHEVALLSGRQLPIKGELNMNLTADGTLNDIKTDGKVQLKKGQLTLGDATPDVIRADGDLTFAGQDLQIEKSQVQFNAYEFGMDGKINLKNLHDPNFDVAFHTKKIAFPVRADAVIDTDLDLNIAGTYSDAAVSGTAQLLDLKLTHPIDIKAIAEDKKDLKLNPTLPFDASQAPFNNWRIDVAASNVQPAKILWQKGEANAEGGFKYDSNGSITAAMRASGKGPAIRLSGETDFQDIGVEYTGGVETSGFDRDHGPDLALTITKGTLLYPTDDSPVWYTAAIATKAGKENITGWIFGREDAMSSFFFSDMPRSEDEIRDLVFKGWANLPTSSGIESLDNAPFKLQQPAASARSFIDYRAP
ncbi:MAG: hypothetical protein WCD79_15485 [Chthoniobacteraceae bacterium]